MKILLLSDIHANLTALEAVMVAVGDSGPIGAIWVSGDTVGYGPDPNECVELVRDSADMVIAGNHELAAIGKMSTEDFNAHAAAVAELHPPPIDAPARRGHTGRTMTRTSSTPRASSSVAILRDRLLVLVLS